MSDMYQCPFESTSGLWSDLADLIPLDRVSSLDELVKMCIMDRLDFMSDLSASNLADWYVHFRQNVNS